MTKGKNTSHHKRTGINGINLFYLISFLEGGAVMACELTGAKLIAPYFGSSLYVWSSVLGTTLGGLTAGYYLGGIFSQKEHVRRILFIILLTSSLLMVFTPFISSLIMGRMINLSVQLGSLVSCLVFIFPVLLCFGMVSPIIIRIVSTDVSEVGKKAGTVYAISTVGGIIMTFSMGFYFIPYMGLIMSCYLTTVLLAIATIVSFVGRTIQIPSYIKKTVSAKPPVKTKRPVRTLPDMMYLVVAFFEGAVVIAVELLGAKMLNPYYGNSLPVWTAVIGITIGFLTLGYFLGGLLASATNRLRILSYAFSIASLLVIIMPVWSRQLFLLAQHMSLYAGCTFVATLLLGPPLLCLGTTSPLIIQQLTRQVQHAGKSAGKVYAVSTMGGIVLTFLLGFLIIPAFGIGKPLMVLSVLLLVLSLVLFFEKKQILVVAAVIVVFIASLAGSSRGKDSGYFTVLHESEGMLGQLKVLASVNPHTKQPVRYLLINGVANTYIIILEKFNTGYSGWEYVHKIAMIASLKRNAQNVLLLGFGAGSLTAELQNMNMRVDALDYDGRMLDIAKKYFYFKDSSTNFIVDDARHYLRTAKKKYDLIAFDVLNSDTQPSYVFTKESLTELKKILSDDGMVIIEFQEFGKTDGPSVYESICNTLLASGYKTYLNQGEDMVIVASLNDIDTSNLAIDNLNVCCRTAPWISEFIKQPFKKCEKPFEKGLLLTDDKPMIDVLNAESIKFLRIKAIESYGNKLLNSGQALFK